MERRHVWDDLRTDLRGLFVGERTVGDSLLAPIGFVTVNAVSSLGTAAAASLAVGGGVAIWRIRRGQQVGYALGGIVAIGFAAFLAVRSGRAESFFLPGIVGAAMLALLSIASIVVRRPLTAWTSWAQRRWPLEWYWRADVRPAYTAVTALWAVYFGARAAIQWWFFAAGNPEALAVAKVVTSWPTILPLLVISYVYGNRLLHRLGGPNVDEFRQGATPPYAGRQRGF